MPILFVTVLIDLIGFGIVIPILPFLSPQLGADKMDIAYIVSIYAVFAGLCGPYWGKLSDHIGRKPVLLICLAGGALSYVMLGLATELWMIYVSRAFAGLMAGNFGVATAMIGDISSPKSRAKNMGLVGAAFGLGMVFGPFLGGVLAGDSGNFTLPCIVAGIVSVVAMLAGGLFLEESLTPEKRQVNREFHRDNKLSILAMLKNTGNRLFACQYALHNTCVSTVTYLFPLWVADLLNWGAKEVGMVFGALGVAMTIFQGGLIGPITARIGEKLFLVIGVATMALAFGIAAIAESTTLMMVSFFLSMLGATVGIPLLNTILTGRTPAELRGKMMGTTSSMSSWGRVIGPLLSGFMLITFGYTGAWLATMFVALLYLSWAVSQLLEFKRKGSTRQSP